VFAQAEPALDENLVHRQQHKPLFVRRETLLGTMVERVAFFSFETRDSNRFFGSASEKVACAG
jgi:hypothetical protein